MVTDINEIIDAFVTEAQAVDGIPVEWLAKQGQYTRGTTGRSIPRKRANRRMPNWTAEEEAFVRQNRPTLSLEEIGEKLGRSANAVKMHGYRIQAATPRHAPGYVSGNQVAEVLGIDSHTPPSWIERGILEGEAIPYDQSRVWRRTTWAAFLRFLVRPASWVYFKVEKIRNDHLRRLVEKAQARWGDRWLSTRQAAELRGCDREDIHNAILRGRLHGYNPGSLERRRKWKWAHNFVRQSEVERLELPWGHDRCRAMKWSNKADEFILRACQEKISYEDMARMMKWPAKRIMYRVMLLRRQGLIGEKPRCRASGRVSDRMCSICGRLSSRRGATCGGEECLKELARRKARLYYARMHPNYKTGIRKPRGHYKPRVKKVKPEKPVKLCEICGRQLEKKKSKLCGSPECKAEMIRRYGRAAYQRKKVKNE